MESRRLPDPAVAGATVGKRGGCSADYCRRRVVAARLAAARGFPLVRLGSRFSRPNLDELAWWRDGDIRRGWQRGGRSQSSERHCEEPKATQQSSPRVMREGWRLLRFARNDGGGGTPRA